MHTEAVKKNIHHSIVELISLEHRIYSGERMGIPSFFRLNYIYILFSYIMRNVYKIS